jgi:hypothetical protein
VAIDQDGVQEFLVPSVGIEFLGWVVAVHEILLRHSPNGGHVALEQVAPSKDALAVE